MYLSIFVFWILLSLYVYDFIEYTEYLIQSLLTETYAVRWILN